jgi:lactoylglutathione lyase
MLRVRRLDEAIKFFGEGLGLQEVRRHDNEAGRFTLVFMMTPDDAARRGEVISPALELTHNWDDEDYAGGRNFGHVAFEVDDIYGACARLAGLGVVINRPPRDGRMAFVRSPDGISVELLQKGEALPPQEPWASAGNVGVW